MTGFKQVRRLGLALIGVAILTVLALALGHSTDLGTAHAVGPGMSLAVPGGDCTDGKCTVDMTQPFVVTISTNPAPDVELAGFATEVVFDTESLNWIRRGSCRDEVQVVRQDGNSIATCLAIVSTLLLGASHNVVSEIGIPPLAALAVAPGSTTTVLVEMDFSCKTAGTFDLTLAAVPDSAFGAVYADVDANEIRVKTVGFDYDGDTVPNQVTDTLTINCQVPPTPTDTPVPPTSTPVPPTNTPGGPTDTPVPPTSTTSPITDTGVNLAAAIIDTTGTSITVGDSSVFEVDDVIQIDSELFLITAINSATNVLTVERGHGGTAAATHSNGADIFAATITAPPTAGTFGESDGGLTGGVVALVSVLLAAAVAGVMTFAWRYGRAR